VYCDDSKRPSAFVLSMPIFQIRDDATGQIRELKIHVPYAFPDRQWVVEKIKANGGDVTGTLANIDVVLVEHNEGPEKLALVKRKVQEGAGIVTLQWIEDSVTKGAMQRKERYTPQNIDSYLELNARSRGRPSQASTSASYARR
jgi:hypothetical protein